MNNRKFKVYPLGENALTVDFGNFISPEVNDLVISLARYFETHAFTGFVETVPAYSSLTIFYDPVLVKKKFDGFATAFAAVQNIVETALGKQISQETTVGNFLEVPVNFSEKYALDLEAVAEMNDLSREKFIELFTAATYRVYMLGFLPGFAYMGEVDERLAAPRQPAPRQKVPAGSVGIAGRQTGIYPFDSPGGWQIIGKTSISLFDPEKQPPTFFRAGDKVKFYRVG